MTLDMLNIFQKLYVSFVGILNKLEEYRKRKNEYDPLIFFHCALPQQTGIVSIRLILKDIGEIRDEKV